MTKRRWSRALAVVAVPAAVLVAACDDERRAISRHDLPEVPDGPTVVVSLSDDGFEPDAVTVTVDDLIAFDISGGDHGVRTDDDRVNTGPLLDGERTLVMLPESGDYEILDTEDASHTMSVTVTDD